MTLPWSIPGLILPKSMFHFRKIGKEDLDSNDKPWAQAQLSIPYLRFENEPQDWQATNLQFTLFPMAVMGIGNFA
jgi:hypothetical protein